MFAVEAINQDFMNQCSIKRISCCRRAESDERLQFAFDFANLTEHDAIFHSNQLKLSTNLKR